jgi:DNA mismatch endonuclease (patch repair protein)
MSANRGSDTRLEITLRKALWKQGVRGYRKNWSKIPGKADIAFPGKKIALFINGCFWHMCSKCSYQLPKSNKKFWRDKFKKNIARDKKIVERLHAMGWSTMTIWEHEIGKDINVTIDKIRDFIYDKTRPQKNKRRWKNFKT